MRLIKLLLEKIFINKDLFLTHMVKNLIYQNLKKITKILIMKPVYSFFKAYWNFQKLLNFKIFQYFGKVDFLAFLGTFNS